MNLRSTATPPQTCRTCGHPFDTATCCEGEFSPAPGDLTLCVECGEPYRLTEQFTVVPAELADLLKLQPDQHALMEKLQEAIRQQRGGRAAP